MSDKTPDRSETSSAKLIGKLRQTITNASDAAGEAARKGVEIGGQIAGAAAQGTQVAVGKVQRMLGEDYYAVLSENPVVLDTLSRSSLLTGNQELLTTAFNLPWATTLLWSAAAGSAIALERPIALAVGDLLHYAPGHIKDWDEINKFMDTATGGGHRLKFGHSIDFLPQIVEKFGIEGAPAFFMHLLQDFTTVDGLPIIPKAWEMKLQLASVAPKMATGLVSISFASLLGALAVIELVSGLWKFGDAMSKKIKTRNYLKTATEAIANRDHNAAIANYRRALEIERSAQVLMALGQVYMQRASTRLRAHRAFTEAVGLLSENPSVVVPYRHARLSVRGLAGIQALATADVLADIHPEHWNDYVRELINATVFSFTSTASKQAAQSDGVVPDMIAAPAQFSAAINYYLAAKSACYYPFAEQRRQSVTRNIQKAMQSLGRMAQYDEAKLRPPSNIIRQLWTMELLPPDEIEMALASW